MKATERKNTLRRYDALPTERRHPSRYDLEQLPSRTFLRAMTQEDERAARAVRQQIPQIARAIELISEHLHGGGRLFFVGAGTSGRLGVIEAAECPPTFHTAPPLVQAVIAGGRRAVFASREGAEDDRRSARATIINRRIKVKDVIVGITASGVTPFVDEALRAAARLGAGTILITCHPHSPIPSNLRIVLHTGPEILAGSTRLKAGTATKLVLNMLTLGSMVRLGKTYGNLMVDVRPTSQKLRARAVRLVQTLTESSEQQAQVALRAANGRVKIAVLMKLGQLSYGDALRSLQKSGDSLTRALDRTRRRVRSGRQSAARSREREQNGSTAR